LAKYNIAFHSRVILLSGRWQGNFLEANFWGQLLKLRCISHTALFTNRKKQQLKCCGEMNVSGIFYHHYYYYLFIYVSH